MEVEVGKIKAETATNIALFQRLKELELYSEKVAILGQTMSSGVAAPDVATTSYTPVTVNTLVHDPDGIIKNASDFTGAGGSNQTITLGAGSYYIRTEFEFTRSTTDGICSCIQRLNTLTPLHFSGDGADQFPITSLNTRAGRGVGVSPASHVSIEAFFDVELKTSIPALTQDFQLESFYSTTSAVSGSPISEALRNEVYGRVIIKKIEKVSLADILK